MNQSFLLGQYVWAEPLCLTGSRSSRGTVWGWHAVGRLAGRPGSLLGKGGVLCCFSTKKILLIYQQS